MRCTIIICANVIGIDARMRGCRDTFASSVRQKIAAANAGAAQEVGIRAVIGALARE